MGFFGLGVETQNILLQGYSDHTYNDVMGQTFEKPLIAIHVIEVYSTQLATQSTFA